LSCPRIAGDDAHREHTAGVLDRVPGPGDRPFARHLTKGRHVSEASRAEHLSLMMGLLPNGSQGGKSRACMGVMVNPRPAWGKCDLETRTFHHLAHHSADVAAVLIELLAHPLIRKRAAGALGRPLAETEIRCLAALAFLHDIGKLAPGFQAKGWADHAGLQLRSHLECGQLWTAHGGPHSLDGAVAHLLRWPIATRLPEWFDALFAHHGRPVSSEPSERGIAKQAFPVLAHYDWRAEEAQMGRALLAWFPEITEGSAPPPEPAFLHHVCGLLTLADWVGSDRRAFPFEHEFRADYWKTARDRARIRLREIGLAPGALTLRGRPDWALISEHPAPRPAQAAVAGLPVSERDWTHELLVTLLYRGEWSVPRLAQLQPGEKAAPMLLVAEAFSRGNSKTDGFRSRVVPVPKAMVAQMFGARPAEVADGILKDIAAIDLALRNGLAVFAAGGDREKVAKPHYARTQPAREALRRHADAMFFPEIWARMAVTHDSGFTPLRRTFLEALSAHARDEFRTAAPGIPCASLMRPRAEVRGRQALERALARAVAKLKVEVPNDV